MMYIIMKILANTKYEKIITFIKNYITDICQ